MSNNTEADEQQRLMLEAVAQGAFGRQAGLDARHYAIAISIANEYVRRGAHAEAVRLFATIVLCDPQNRDAQRGLAAGALEVGQPYVAIQAAAALIAAEPFDPRGYLLSGKACRMAGEMPEAREDLARAAELAHARGDAALANEASALLDSLGQAPPPAAAAAAAPTTLRFG